MKQRISELESADDLSVIKRIPILRLHEHKGKGVGTWSIDVKDNWRILFKIRTNPIPTLDDGSVDLKGITIIGITDVVDPH